MATAQEPPRVCVAEGARVHPSFDLGPRHPRSEKARRVLQEPRSAECPDCRAGPAAEATGQSAEGAAGPVRAGRDGLSGLQTGRGRRSGSVAELADQCGRQRTKEEGCQRPAAQERTIGVMALHPIGRSMMDRRRAALAVVCLSCAVLLAGCTSRVGFDKTLTLEPGAIKMYTIDAPRREQK